MLKNISPHFLCSVYNCSSQFRPGSHHSLTESSRPPSGATTLRNPGRPHSQVSAMTGARPRSLSRTNVASSTTNPGTNRSTVVRPGLLFNLSYTHTHIHTHTLSLSLSLSLCLFLTKSRDVFSLSPYLSHCHWVYFISSPPPIFLYFTHSLCQIWQKERL